jgi:hypothetical protein
MKKTYTMTLEQDTIENIKSRTKNLSGLIESLASKWLSAQKVDDERSTIIAELKTIYEENKQVSNMAYDKWYSEFKVAHDAENKITRDKEIKELETQILISKEIDKLKPGKDDQQIDLLDEKKLMLWEKLKKKKNEE